MPSSTSHLRASCVLAGLRDGHEPYRHLATQAANAFIATQSPHVAAAVPLLVKPLRLALQMYEPSLVGHALVMLQKWVPWSWWWFEDKDRWFALLHWVVCVTAAGGWGVTGSSLLALVPLFMWTASKGGK
jgi:hypothetical protein